MDHHIYLLLIIYSPLISTTPDPQAVIDAVMSESLRSNRVQACDGERITFQCPKNTHIQIETGFYGRVVPVEELCPERNGKSIPSRPFYDATCDVIHAQSRLSEMCDKRRKCTIIVDASTFQEDPCPSTSKYLQMSYRCTPVSFDGESFCSGTEMHLECREGRRLAIYSATYGRSPRGHPSFCDLPPKHLINTECSRDILPHVLSRCHAQTDCSLSINNDVMGNICPPSVSPYLHILFMCVNEEVFSEDAIKGELKSQKKLIMWNEKESIEWKRDEVNGSGEERVNDDGLSRETTSVFPPTREILHDASFIHNPTQSSFYPPTTSQTLVQVDNQNAIGMAHDLMLIWRFLRENKEKVLLCTILSCSIALILLVLACILQQFCPKKDTKDPRVAYSIERSNLINRSHHLLDGHHHHSSFVEMADLGDDTYMRYSYHTPTRSIHYDFT